MRLSKELEKTMSKEDFENFQKSKYYYPFQVCIYLLIGLILFTVIYAVINIII